MLALFIRKIIVLPVSVRETTVNDACQTKSKLMWIEPPPPLCVWEVIGSNPVGDSEFSFVPRS